MGGATLRFFTLLSSPLPLLHPLRHSSLRFLHRLVSHRSSLFLSPSLSPPPLFFSPPKCSQQLHTHQAHPCSDETPSLNSTGFSNSTANFHHPWPEFSGFVNWVSQSRYCNAPFDAAHQFVGVEQFDQTFLRVANCCLAFARDNPTILWSLPREDIDVIVENGSPFFFANASAAVARMKAFTDNVLESDKPGTVDLMEFLLSYAYKAIDISENTEISSKVESSVRKLFSKLVNYKEIAVEPIVTAPKEYSERYSQASSSSGNDLKMKKGDWMCPRCNFMNFAKNSLCLQCEEHRPKNLLTGGEWECPQCHFFNFGRNVACLRCDCKKPRVNRFLSPTFVSTLRADTAASVEGNTEEIISGTEEMQSWFTKIAQLEKSSDMGSVLTDEDLPETMKAGDNKFTWSAARTKNTGSVDNSSHSYIQTDNYKEGINMKISQSLDELTGGKSPNQMGNKDYEREQTDKSERWFKKVAELHDVKDLPSAISDDDFPEIVPMRKGENRFVVSKKKDRSLTSPMYKRRVAMEQAGNNNYVPFVPFPPDHFAKEKSQGSEPTHINKQTSEMSSNSVEKGEGAKDKIIKPAFEVSDQNPKTIDSPFSTPSNYSKSQSTSENASVGDSWRERSLEGSAVKEPNPLDMSEEAKAERWFRRVAHIKDISELSQIPDEDFPSIMPMRKGVNRFVVSKRKTPLERRLTSSQYRRNLPVVNSDSERKETD